MSRIYRYPVKSMAAEAVAAASAGHNGLNGDRRFAFSRVGNTSGFPWLTGRNLPSLITYRPYFVEADAESQSGLRVITPETDDLELSSPDLKARIEAAYGNDVELVHVDRGLYDEAHVSIISSQSIAALQQETATSLDERRFRPNLVVETFGSVPFEEEKWVGCRLTFGEGPASAAISATHRDKRCVMINLDPATVEVDSNVLKTVVRTGGSCAGIYGAVVRTGVIRQGDLIFIEERDRSCRPVEAPAIYRPPS